MTCLLGLAVRWGAQVHTNGNFSENAKKKVIVEVMQFVLFIEEGNLMHGQVDPTKKKKKKTTSLLLFYYIIIIFITQKIIIIIILYNKISIKIMLLVVVTTLTTQIAIWRSANNAASTSVLFVGTKI